MATATEGFAMLGQDPDMAGRRWRAVLPADGHPLRRNPWRARGLRGLAVVVAALLPLTSGPALAQSEASGAATDPPTLVGQLTRVSGTVSFHTADETTWRPADPNYPITSGNSLWTQPSSGASVVFGANRVAMDQATELDIGTLDQHRFVATVPQGSVFVHMRGMQPGDAVMIQTPRGTVSIGQNGIYEIAAGDQVNPTRVTAVQGAAQVSGSGVSAVVQQGQTATITGSGPFTASLGPAQQDQFLAGQLPQAAPPPPNGVAPPPAVAQMTGGEELAGTGTWATTPQYGEVWYPPVAPGWVPYREGHWAWVAPWGWTWVDDAPWGFAPFHYGRWVEIGPRWGWVPVEPGYAYSVAAPPVYAPAMVAFFGLGVVGVAIAVGHPVGWCPLGPGEPYHPWYHASPTYIRNVNVVNVRNINRVNVTNVYNTTTINHFVNRNSVTVVNSQVMSGSRPVGRNLEHVAPTRYESARPYTSAPVRPTATTAGLTPAVAKQYGMAPVAPQRIAPGPVVRPERVGAPVPLRPKGGAPVVNPRITSPEAPRPAANRVPEPAAPHAPGPQAPRATAPTRSEPLPPARPEVQAPRPTSVPRQGAPGPAIVPHSQGVPPPLRPEAQPQRPVPQPQRPEAQAPRYVPPTPPHPEAQPPRPTSVPHQGAPGPVIVPHSQGAPPPLRPEVQAPRYTPPAPPRPEAQPPRPAPQQARPEPPRPAPAPMPQQHYTPPPAPRPEPPRPAPQPQHYTPPPAPRPEPPRPAPVPHYNPPPAPHYEAPRPPPAPHYNPPPRPEPPHPAPSSSCHPGQRCG